MIVYFYKSLKSKQLSKSRKQKIGSITVVTNVSREELEKIARDNRLVIEDLVDVFDTQEIPRLELNEKTMLLIVRYPGSLETGEAATKLLFIVFYRGKLSLISANKISILDEFFQEKKWLATTQPANFLIQLLLYISKRYALKVNSIHRQLESVRSRLRSASSKDVETLIEYESILNEYLLALVPMQMMYQEIVTGKYIPLFAEDEALFEDLINNIRQASDICKTSLKHIISLRDSFEIIVSNRLNQTVKLLTSVTILLTIPTIIASIYGMNVDLPLDEHAQAFWIIASIVVVAVTLTAWLFKKNKWF